MLEKPDIHDEKITACLKIDFGLLASQIKFMPIGADPNTAVYRAEVENGAPLFIKLRKGNLDEAAVTLPKFLNDHGIPNINPPLTTRTGQLWAILENYKLILYPYIEGRNGFEIDMSDRNWFDLRTALQKLHTVEIPLSITSHIQRETYPAHGQEIVKKSLRLIDAESFSDPVAMGLAAFLKTKCNEIFDLLNRAEHLAFKLQTDPPTFTVCHSDVHAGNILIDDDNILYIVDWDNPILAPKERDLMFPGGAQGFTGHTLQEEEILFYRGYGQVEINQTAMAYYRYERIIQDIAVYCEQLLMSNEGGNDREQSLEFLKSNFLPNKTLETACKADRVIK